MAIEHDFFGLLSSGPDGSIFWSETVEFGDHALTVDLTAPDQEDVSRESLDIAAAFVSGLEAIDDKARRGMLAEVDDRDRRSTLRRIKSAGFPREKWLADFDFTANPNINPATINELATGDWIRRGDPLCLIGDSGTGKSHLLIALGTAAAEQGYRVRYTLATRLVNELVEAADEKQLARTIARYGRVDLLVIDELGYMELDRRGAELLFQVLTEREEENACAIASNQSFSAWTDTFTDPRLCAAIVDRLTYNATIIETGTNSYRLAHTRARHRTPATGA